MTEEYQIKHNVPSLTIKGPNILSPGEFGCICGLPGSGKTAVIEMLVVAYLVDLHNLKDIDTNDIEIETRDGCIALLDTERPPDDNKGSWNRIKTKTRAKENGLIGYNEKINGSWIKGFYHFTLAEVQSLDDLKKHLRQAYICARNGFVIIDGVLDFVASMNSEEDTKALIILIRSLSVLYDVTTVTTLHPNKNTEIIAGHLGSNAYRWDRACLLVRSCEDDKSVRELTTNFGMGKLAHGDVNTFPGIHFRWSETSKMMVPADKPEATLIDKDALTAIFQQALISTNGRVPSSELKEKYSEVAGINKRSSERHCGQALKSGFMQSTGAGSATKYFLTQNEENDEEF